MALLALITALLMAISLWLTAYLHATTHELAEWLRTIGPTGEEVAGMVLLATGALVALLWLCVLLLVVAVALWWIKPE